MADDMMSKLSDILENPEAMEKIKSIAESLGGSAGAPSTAAEIPVSSASETGSPVSSASSENSAGGLLSGLDISLDSDRTIALLEAIRPFMRSSRVPKVDTAIKAVQMMGVLSKLK